MPDQIEISYKNGDWTDISSLCTEFSVEDFGISRVPSATVRLHSDYANLAGLLASHHKDFRILIKPVGAFDFYRIFYGNIWEPTAQLETSNASKLSMQLDCRNFAQRLADDTVTWNYFALQSAMSPEILWRYKDVIDDFLLVPDSAYNTGVTLDVAESGNIMAAVDRAATFDRQTLLDALRTIADYIGYDGYFDLSGDNMKVNLFPFGTGGSVATLAHPFLATPKWSGGSLDDVINYILVTGGNDGGIPADGDRLTEKGHSKYSPQIWGLHVASGDGYVADHWNTDFDKPETDYGSGDYCIRGEVTTNEDSMYLELNPSACEDTHITTFDCKNRFSELKFHLRTVCISNPQILPADGLRIFLEDSSERRIKYSYHNTENYYYQNSKIYLVKVPVGPQNKILQKEDPSVNAWSYDTFASPFDWETVKKIRFETHCARVLQGFSKQWAIEIDGLQFVGGLAIDPFSRYADVLNPPVKDEESINTYGLRVNHLNDSQITQFEQAQNEGNRVLANLKQPIATLELKKPALTTSVKPSNLVTVTIPQLAISAEEWRLIGLKYDWNAKRKTVHQSFTLTKKLNPLPPLWATQPELRALVK